MMIWAVIATFLLQFALLYIPFMQQIFETEPLTASDFVIAVIASAIVFVAVEMDKWIGRRRERSKQL
jgi:Ca2+-transporting ATPase